MKQINLMENAVREVMKKEKRKKEFDKHPTITKVLSMLIDECNEVHKEINTIFVLNICLIILFVFTTIFIALLLAK